MEAGILLPQTGGRNIHSISLILFCDYFYSIRILINTKQNYLYVYHKKSSFRYNAKYKWTLV
ncbi:MAG: hypothetical protein M3297_15755, partial [Thermoproteota archaeon]|nr:hypothetical protein [Thermoproteota archaeon]